MERTLISSGTHWESRIGYSRAVRVGNHIHVSGTTATNADGDIVGIDDPRAQTEQTLRNIETAVQNADATLEDVVRTRVFITNTDHWEAIGDVHAAFFGEIRPATSMIEINGLIDPALLVEIEATAIVTEQEP